MHLNKRKCHENNCKRSQKKAKLAHLDECFTLELLPNELILYIVKFLRMKDIISLSHASKKLFQLVESNLSTWKSFLNQHEFSRTEVIESQLEGFNTSHRVQALATVTKDMFQSYIKTRRSLVDGNYSVKQHLYSYAYNSTNLPSVFNVSVLSTSSNILRLSVWNEITEETNDISFETKNKDLLGLADSDGSEFRKIVVSMAGALVVFNSITVKATKAYSSFVSVLQLDLGKNEVKSLWHQKSPSHGINWWICLTGDKMFNFEVNLAEKSSTLHGLEPRSGHVRWSIKLPFTHGRSVQDYCSYNDSWIAIAVPFHSEIVLINVAKETVKYIELKSNLSQTGKVEVKNNLVFAMSMDNSIIVLDAQTGGNILFVINQFPPIDGFVVTDRNILVWSNRKLVNYKFGQKECKPDTEFLNLDHFTSSNTFDTMLDLDMSDYSVSDDDFVHDNEDEVYVDIVGVQLVQNVAVVCYTINDVFTDKCSIKLAFIPTSYKEGDKVNEINVHNENSCIRPEYIQLQTMPTSVIVNIPFVKRKFIYKFFAK